MKLYIMQFSPISYQSQPQIMIEQRCSQTQLPIHLQCHSQSIRPIYLKILCKHNKCSYFNGPVFRMREGELNNLKMQLALLEINLSKFLDLEYLFPNATSK
jgi:hypothetical protein